MTISEKPSETETTMLRMMLRPRWIGALVFALVLAAAFAWLGQWQLERAIESGKVIDTPTETVVPLTSAAKPGGPIHTAVVGQKVEFTGSFVPTDYELLHGRLNYGRAGYWVTAHVTLSAPDAAGRRVAIAVARGWAPTKAQADAVVARLRTVPESSVTVDGRLLPTEAPEVPSANGDPYAMKDMSVAALFNLWTDVKNTDVYSAYVVQKTPPAGLDAIYSPPPIESATLDWLNIFYAAEWVIFAGFAIFFWYRLVKDAKEKEDEEREEALSEVKVKVTVN